MAVPSGLAAHETTYESVAYSVAGLLERSSPTFTLPSWRPKTISLGRCSGHVMQVMEDACWNLLQMDFLSPHSVPSWGAGGRSARSQMSACGCGRPHGCVRATNDGQTQSQRPTERRTR